MPVGGEIRNEATKRFAVWVASGVVTMLIIAATGWWFYLQPKLIGLVGGTPPGAVAAFDLSRCPGGWEPFEKGNGRVLVGAGKPPSSSAVDDAGRPLSDRSPGVVGGVQDNYLTIREMPAHQHQAWRYSNSNSARPAGTGDGLWGVITDYNTASVGEGKPFTNMPPFVALLLCKKSPYRLE